MVAAVLLAPLASSAQKTVTFIDAWHDFPGPQAYRDIRTGTSFYVESDGRHAAPSCLCS